MIDKNQIAPLFSRVTHFDGGENTQGKGTIVKYNGTKPNAYMQEHLIDAAEIASKVDAIAVMIETFFDKTRCPYIVQWDNGLREVYEPESLTLIPEDQVKKVHDIVEIELPSYDSTFGSNAEGESFRFLTNSRERLFYEETVRRHVGESEFGISNEAYGFDEEEGRSFRLGNDYFAFYVRNESQEESVLFWNNLRIVQEQLKDIK